MNKRGLDELLKYSEMGRIQAMTFYNSSPLDKQGNKIFGWTCADINKGDLLVELTNRKLIVLPLKNLDKLTKKLTQIPSWLKKAKKRQKSA